jgi:hypothetical protein
MKGPAQRFEVSFRSQSRAMRQRSSFMRGALADAARDPYIEGVTLEDLTDLYGEHVEQLGTRYAQALASCGYEAAVIHSGAPKKRTEFDDQYWPLRVTHRTTHSPTVPRAVAANAAASRHIASRA